MTPDSPAPIDPREILAAVRRQLPALLAGCLAALVVALLYLVAVEPIYTARALVLVDPEDRSLLDTGGGRRAGQDDITALVDSEVAILNSDSVLLATVEALDLLASPDFRPRPGLVATLRTALGAPPPPPASGADLLGEVLEEVAEVAEARRLGLTHLIQVTAESPDPQRAAALANGLAETYIGLQLRSKTDSALAGGERLRGQLEAARLRLAASEEALDTYVAQASGPGGANFSELPALRGALTRTEREHSALEARLAAADGALRMRDWTALASALQADAVEELAQSYDRTERLFEVAAPGSEAALDLAAELARLDTRLGEDSQARVASMRARIADLERSEASTRQALQEGLQASDLPATALADLYELQQDAEIARRQYAALLSRARHLETEALVQVADSRIAAPALAPAEPSAPDLAFVLTLALVMGLGSGGGAALLRAHVFGGIVSEQQLARITHCRIGTTVPRAGCPADGRSVADLVAEEPLSPFAESIRRLRAAIDQRSGTGTVRGQVILVTSPLPGEGKTTTALALARSLTQIGRQVLLLDADLRRPGLHCHLGSPAEGRAALEDLGPEALASLPVADPRSGAACLAFRTEAKEPPDRLLQAPAFRQVLEAARERYDAIIVDTPPLLPVVDARCLAPLADCILLCVAAERTGQAEVRQGVEELRAGLAGADPVLTVLTMQAPADSAYGYYREERPLAT